MSDPAEAGPMAMGITPPSPPWGDALRGQAGRGRVDEVAQWRQTKDDGPGWP